MKLIFVSLNSWELAHFLAQCYLLDIVMVKEIWAAQNRCISTTVVAMER